MPEENTAYEILETACATVPSRHFIIIRAKDIRTGEPLWAIGDDQACAITRGDFIRNRKIAYKDVLIQKFSYRDNSPESVGEWRPLIRELVDRMLQKHLEYNHFVHVYPQWLPDDFQTNMPLKMFEQHCKDSDHIILYASGAMDFVPKPPRSDNKDFI